MTDGGRAARRVRIVEPDKVGGSENGKRDRPERIP